MCKQLSYREIGGPNGPLAKLQPFKGNSLQGTEGAGGWLSGRLSGPDEAKWQEDRSYIAYAVWSYGTPIAWVDVDGITYYVGQKFSVTTSKQQSLVRAWLAPSYDLDRED